MDPTPSSTYMPDVQLVCVVLPRLGASPRGHCRPCYHEPGRPPYPPPSGKTPALSLSWSNWGQQYEGPQSRQGPGFQLLDSHLFCGLVKLPPPWASVSPKVLAESCSPSSVPRSQDGDSSLVPTGGMESRALARPLLLLPWRMCWAWGKISLSPEWPLPEGPPKSV